MPNNAQAPFNDMRLFKDEADVQYCKTFNSCKVPQVRNFVKNGNVYFNVYYKIQLKLRTLLFWLGFLKFTYNEY